MNSKNMKSIIKNIIVYIITWQAKMIVKKYHPQIIAIGGDVGKTTTKDAIYEVVKQKFTTRKSQKSFNSETGLPLSIIGADSGWNSPRKWLGVIMRGFELLIKKQKYPDYLVLELGDRKPGDSKTLTEWLQPDILVLTKIDEIPTHVEFFESIKASRSEKTDLVRAVKKEGIVIINHDDPLALEVIENSRRQDINVLQFSETEKNTDLFIKQISIIKKEDLLGTRISLVHQDQDAVIFVAGQLGDGLAKSVATAALVGLALDISLETSAYAFAEETDLARGRLRAIPGVKRTVLIDDTYNAGFASTKLALETLSQTPKANRRIALLADMLELGKHSQEAHEAIGALAPEHCDILITVGAHSRSIATAAKNAGMKTKEVFTFSNAGEAGKFAEQMISPGDVVLIKGSQGLRMERAVQEMMLHPEERDKLLVRQEREWLSKK